MLKYNHVLHQIHHYILIKNNIFFFVFLFISAIVITDSMYDYQSQTSLPPIRPRQQRPSGVQVQQLYESSPVLATLSHHPSHKHQHGDSSTATTNGYHHHHHHHHNQNNSISQIPNQQQTSEQSMRKSPSVDSMLSMRSSSQQRRSSNVLDPDMAMKTYMSKLTAFERHEIFSYPQIYFVGQNARKRQGVGGGPNNGMNNRKKISSFFYDKEINFFQVIMMMKMVHILLFNMIISLIALKF